MIIGLAGRIGSGKSTVAEWLRENCGFEVTSFATYLRGEVAKAISLYEVYYDSELRGSDEFDAEIVKRRMDVYKDLKDPDQKPRYRGILQWWGTEYRRGQDPEYWVKKMEPWISEAAERGIDLVVDDVRFLNEVEMLQNYGGKVFRVVGQDDIPSPHKSENSIDNTMMHGFISNSDRSEVGRGMLKFTLMGWSDSGYDGGWWGP